MKAIIFAATAASLLSAGLAQQFVMYTGGTEDGDDFSVERIDPILAPGHISQHVHQVFGSNGLRPEVTYESLQQASCTTVGRAGGAAFNAADKSIYWHPALFMEAADGSGYIRVPTLGHKLYYKDVGSENDKKADPFEFPHGFRMLAGNPFMRGPAFNEERQNITQWICHTDGPQNQGTSGGFPTGVSDCTAYPFFNGAIHFPHCWNGQDFDPENPTAHVSYPTGDIQMGDCPSSHPTRVPHIFMENAFNIHSVVDKVKPDSFVLAMGDNTGYGWHADFFNGWDDGAIPELFETCPQGEYGNEDIGDCPSFKAGDAATSDCKLPGFFKENVNTPNPLPGCNPIIDINPAPIFAIAALGKYSTHCSLASKEGGSGGVNSVVGGAVSSILGGAGDAVSSVMGGRATPLASPSATTFAISTKSHASAAGPTGGGLGDHSTTDDSVVPCPSSHGQAYTAPSGQTFQIQCGIDHFDGNLKSISASSLTECIAACDATEGCVDVSLSGVACYMKSSVGKAIPMAGLSGARLINSSDEASAASAFVSDKGAVEVAGSHPDTSLVTVTRTVTVMAAPTPLGKRDGRRGHARAHIRRAGSF